MESIITKKDVMYNLRISNLLTLPKQIQKDLVFTLLVFVPVTHGNNYLFKSLKEYAQKLHQMGRGGGRSSMKKVTEK